MATIADLYNDTQGRRPLGSAFAEDFWRTDPRQNTMLLEPTDDYRLLAYNEQVQNLSDRLLKKNQANKAKRDMDFLKSLVAQQNVNLFAAPTNEGEARAQSLVQEHINAGRRGLKAAADVNNANQKAREAAFARNLQARDQAMQEASFRRDAARERALLPLQLDEYAERKRDRETDNVRQREALTQSRELAKERALANEFQAALKLVEDDGANPRDLLNAFPNLRPEHFSALDAAAKAINADDWRNFNAIKASAEGYSKQLDDALSTAETTYAEGARGWFGRDKSTPEGRQAAREAARQRFVGSNEKDLAREGLRFDPTTGRIVPFAPTPDQYDPLDMAMLSARRGGRPVTQSAGRLAQGIPVIQSQADLQRYSNFPVVQSPDGRRKRNPYYRPNQGMRVPPPEPVTSYDLPQQTSDEYLSYMMGF